MPNEDLNQNNFDINQFMGSANKNVNINISQSPNQYIQGVDTIPIIGPVDDSVNKYMTTVNIVQNSPIMNNPQYGHHFETPINNNNQVLSSPFTDIKGHKPAITPSTPAMHKEPQLAFNQNQNFSSTPLISSPRQRTEQNDNINEQIKQLLNEQNINTDLDSQIEMQAEVKKLNSSLKPLTTTKVLPVQTTTKILPPIGVSSLNGVNLDQLVNINSQNQNNVNYQNVQVYQTEVPSQNEFIQPIMNSPIQSNVVVTTKQVKTNINKKVISNNNNPININKNVNNINRIENAEVKILRQSYKDEINVLKQENAALKKQLAEIKQMKDTLEEEAMALRNKLAEIEPLKKKMAEMEVLRGQLTELNTLRAQVAEYNAVKAQLKEMGNLKSQIEQMNSLKAQLAELKEFKKNAEAKIEELEKLNNKYEEEHKTKLKQNQSDKNEDGEMQNEEDEEDSQNITVKGDIIHDVSELEMLTKKINKDNKKLTLNLLYKATADSDKAAAFHAKCDEAKSSIVLVETDKGKRFGGYTTQSWSGDCTDKKDEEAFVFSFDKMETYDNIPGEDAIGCYPKFGPIFLGCQIRIYDNAFSKGGTTFERSLNFDTKEDFELTGGDRVFNVKEIEVYEVFIED
jgi:myosin heavy subunit